MRVFAYLLPVLTVGQLSTDFLYQQTREEFRKAQRELERAAGVIPNLIPDWVDEDSPFGALVFEETLSVGTSSVVHIATLEPWDDGEEWESGRPLFEPLPDELVVKYMDDCALRLNGVPAEQMLNEYLMLRILNSSGLTPKVFFLSDPATLDDSVEAIPDRLMSEILQKRWGDCVAKETQIGYMLMEKVGPSVSDYVEHMQSNPTLFASSEFTRRVLVICRKIVQLLKGLHARGIVHSDIHLGNVAFKRSVKDLSDINVDTDELVLLDFEFASFFLEKVGTPVENDPVTRARTQSLRAHFLSPWQLMNQRSGPRDDVYRALLLTAAWLSRHNFMKGYTSLLRTNVHTLGNPPLHTPKHKQIQRELTKYIRFNAPMFTYSYLLGSVAVIGDNVPMDRHDMIRSKLEGLHKLIGTCDHPDKQIDYDHFDRELESTLSLFQY